MTTDINVDWESASILAWVAQGAGNDDHDSVLIIDVKDNGKAEISTNSVTGYRSVTVSCDSSDNTVVAVRAKAILGIANKVEEGDSMSLKINDRTIHIASGATSATLQNLAPHVIRSSHERDHSSVVTAEAIPVLDSMYRAASATTSKGNVIITVEDNTFTVGSGNDTVYTQELFSATPSPGSDNARYLVHSQHFKTVRPLPKIEQLGDMEMHVGTGYLFFTIPLPPSGTAKSLSFVIPTVVSTVQHAETPCDNDIMNSLTVAKKSLNNALKPILGVVSADATVTLDLPGNTYMAVKVSDTDGDAKTTIIDAVVTRQGSLSMPIHGLVSALKSIKSEDLMLGTIDFDDEQWISVTPVFNEAAESELDNNDIVVAIAPREDEET